MSARKQELLNGVLGYLTKHGLNGLALRPLAQALGTSPRILMFHFKSKEGLLQETIRELHLRLQQSLSTISAQRNDARSPPLKRFWLWAIHEDNFPRLRLVYELHILAIQSPQHYGRYVKESSLGWQTTAWKVMSGPLRDKAMATLCIAVFDGLFMEFMSSGDPGRLTRALNRFVSIARSSSRDPR